MRPDSDDDNYELLLKGELDAVMQTTGPRYFSMFGPDHIAFYSQSWSS